MPITTPITIINDDEKAHLTALIAGLQNILSTSADDAGAAAQATDVTADALSTQLIADVDRLIALINNLPHTPITAIDEADLLRLLGHPTGEPTQGTQFPEETPGSIEFHKCLSDFFAAIDLEADTELTNALNSVAAPNIRKAKNALHATLSGSLYNSDGAAEAYIGIMTLERSRQQRWASKNRLSATLAR
jgi:hypothetical protein